MRPSLDGPSSSHSELQDSSSLTHLLARFLSLLLKSPRFWCVPVKPEPGVNVSSLPTMRVSRSAMNSYVTLMNSSVNGHEAYNSLAQKRERAILSEEMSESRSGECRRRINAH